MLWDSRGTQQCSQQTTANCSRGKCVLSLCHLINSPTGQMRAVTHEFLKIPTGITKSDFWVSSFHFSHSILDSSRSIPESRTPGPAAEGRDSRGRRGVSNSGVLSVQFSWLSLPFTVVFWCSFFILFLVWHCRVGIFYCLGCSPSCIICTSWSPFLCPLFLGKYCVVG